MPAPTMQDPIASLLSLTETYLGRSRSPYSREAASAVVLLADGTWAPGVRVESASFSLTIDEALNAVSTAVAAGRRDIVAVALSREAALHQTAYLEGLDLAPLIRTSDRLFTLPGAIVPAPTTLLDPTLVLPDSDEERIRFTRRLAERAYVPASSFPVGCVALLRDGTAVPGVNVEHPDWSRILCAERNAVGTALSYGLGPVTRLYLSCPLDPEGTPCGACRQVLAELAAASTIVMDRHPAPARMTTPEALLPDSFTGTALLRRRSPETDPLPSSES